MKIEQGEIIKLSNGRDYLCFAVEDDAERSYLYLISTNEPMEMRIADQKLEENGDVDIRMVTERDEKLEALKLFQQRHAGGQQG